MRRFLTLISAALLCLSLSGCSAVAFWLSGCGSPEADLVVINNGSQAVWSIALDYENETSAVQNARSRALMERGESYGLLLDEGTERVTVSLYDRMNRKLAQGAVDFAGERLYLTLERDGTLSVSEGWPDV